jgi:DNA phosphorothioation-dependent restriction protein DptG
MRGPDAAARIRLAHCDRWQAAPVALRALKGRHHREINNLPEEDRRRLRRKQRLYVEEWIHLLNELRPDLTDADARVIVHAAIGAIQSTLFHNSGMAGERLRGLLTETAWAVLGISGAQW